MPIRNNRMKVATFVAFGALLLLAGCGEGPSATDPGLEDAAATDGVDFDPIPIVGEPVHILAFGDSLFAGYGLKDAQGDSYPAKLEAALRARGINALMTNAGVSGDTSAAGLTRLAFVLDAQEHKPDLFILELGGNDLLRGLSPDQTRANFIAMLDLLAARDIPVLLMGMRAPPNYGPEYQQAFDAIYGDLAAQYSSALIPFWLEDIYRQPQLFQSDNIHPTVEGIEELVVSTVDQVSAALPQESAD